ncbi:GTPase IMAP family member 8-like isoform X1 [Podarcis lilfordi]|uniref:GTPase IMAP family member 8-like isoform X1 n=1 Tax=Podarcis lilfordi TaxID=74358 RepID=A0AA35PIH4_9SAUR|nr:GTPase IMAP family member 8-like isoform X1 [Podarcis lilfordi]
MIVLFTRKEDLETESLQEYIGLSGNRVLQDLVGKCKGRCCAFNNRGTGEERASQAEELLSLIEKVVQENGDQPYLKPCLMEMSLRSDGRNPGETSKQTAAGEPVEDEMNAGEIPEGQKKKKSKKASISAVGSLCSCFALKSGEASKEGKRGAGRSHPPM